MTLGEARPGAALGPVVRLVLGVGGLATCITLLFLGMRAVMDVGGMCAEGGPYEIATTCPDDSTAATLLGIFGLFLFGGIAMWGGMALGGAWVSLPGLGWTALFGALGWNFLDYGLLNPPEGETIVWGWLIPGIMFEVMAFGPILLGVWAMRTESWQGTRLRAAGLTVPMPGPRQPGPWSRGSTRVVPSAPVEGSGEFREDTQALLDRLERLADLRDRGQLQPDEYDTAKEAVMRELEARS